MSKTVRVIERHRAAGGDSPQRDFEHGKQIRVPLSEEHSRVEKRPVLREPVEVGKRQVQDTKKVSADAKHEELDITSEGDVQIDDRKKLAA